MCNDYVSFCKFYCFILFSFSLWKKAAVLFRCVTMIANRFGKFSLAINNVTNIDTQTACDDRSVPQIALY